MAKLEVKNLTISFRTNNGAVRAVRDVSFDLNEGETLAIAGESGSGKSVTTRAVMGILAGNAMVDAGEIIYDGKDLLKIPEEEFHTLRGHKLAMVFQDPLSALNPIMRIGRQLTEAMLLNNKERRRDGKEQFNKLLKTLEKAMTEAAGADQQRVHGQIQQFDGFVTIAVKEEYAYKEALESAVEATDCVEEIEDAILKHSDKDVREVCRRLNGALKHVFNPYLFPVGSPEIADFSRRLAGFGGYTGRQQQELEKLLGEMKDALNKRINAEMPNFFCIGYSVQQGKAPDPTRQSVEEINAQARKTLDEGFMNGFLKEIEKALEHTEKQSLTGKRAAVDAVKKAISVFQAKPLDEKRCREALKASAASVEASIDPLQLDKDSLSYVYRSGVQAYLNRYKLSLRQNPREEKRFARDTVKFERETAKGKVPPSVVPKNLIDPDAVQQNLCSLAESVVDRFSRQIEAGPQGNYPQRAIDMVDYLKARAEDYAFRLSKGMARHRAIELMKEVGIPEPHKRFHQYPFEFSGGMRQRIVIAIALSANPDILICDEPTTALDVTIQAKFLELIKDIQTRMKLSVIYITHDLGVVAKVADYVNVMYAGKIIEVGTVNEIFYDPRHPYTWGLLSAMPDLATDDDRLYSIPGSPPNLLHEPAGDAFAARNTFAMKIDEKVEPPLFKISDTHYAATWLLHPDAPKVEMPPELRVRLERSRREAEQYK